MSTATLTPPDVARAAADSDYYAEQIHLLRTETERDAFAAQVEAAYDASHAPRPLSYEQRRILAFEHKHFRVPGAKEAAIRDEFGYPATRYYQALNALIDDPAALRADPVTVGRLRRQREIRQARRAVRSTRPDTARSAA